MNKKKWIAKLCVLMMIITMTVECIYIDIATSTDAKTKDKSIEYVKALYENELIAHGCGGYARRDEKIPYTNSQEALKHAKKWKYRLLELDVATTRDGVLVCTHDSPGALTGRGVTWRNKPKYGFTRHTLKEFFKSVKNYDALIILDMKGVKKPGAYEKRYKRIIKMARSVGGQKLVDRIIPQVYTLGQLKKIQKVRKWDCLIFSMYKYSSLNYKKMKKTINQIAKYKNVKGITVPKKYMTTRVVNLIHSKNMLALTHTVNSIKSIKKYRSRGVDVFYTDYVSPKKYRKYFKKRTYKVSTKKKKTTTEVVTTEVVDTTEMVTTEVVEDTSENSSEEATTEENTEETTEVEDTSEVDSTTEDSV